MPNAGEFVDVADVIVPQFIRKAASESVTSSTTPQNDDDLFAALPVGLWRVQLLLSATGATAGDIRVMWTTTGTMTVNSRSCWGPQSGTADITNTAMVARAAVASTQVVYGVDGSGLGSGILEDLHVDVTVTGTLQMQWAQGTSSGTATTLSTQSRMYITRIEAY